MLPSSNVLFITGVPGIGKTTIIKKVAASIPGHNVSGFYTEEIRVNNVRQGFALVTLQGERFVMAHVESDSPFRVGKYGVNVPIIDRVAAMTMSEDRDKELFIIDEIGKMECFSDLFIERMSALLQAGKTVLATVALKGGGFIAEVKTRPGIMLWEVTRQNRDTIHVQVVSWIQERFKDYFDRKIYSD